MSLMFIYLCMYGSHSLFPGVSGRGGWLELSKEEHEGWEAISYETLGLLLRMTANIH